MVRRSALIVIGAATVASFAAGWWTGVAAKSRPHSMLPETADLPSAGCTLIFDPDTNHLRDGVRQH